MSNKIDALKPQRKIELFSGSYFAACTMGGIIACGPTHTMVTPLDLVSFEFQKTFQKGQLNAEVDGLDLRG